MAQTQSAGDAQYIKMTKTPIPRLITGLAVPTIISMMITAVYNTADTFFVSKLGTSATGAVGIVFSVMAIIQAIGFTLGMGSGSLSSRLLGKREDQKANVIASSAFFTAIGVGVLITVCGILFLDPIMHVLGATDTILPYSRGYAQYIFFGAPIMCASFVLNNLLRSQGRAVLAMAGIATGGVLNLILDPVFIFVFGLGISGAAIATLISQCVSFGILIFMFLTGKSVLKVSVKSVSRHITDYWMIVKTGFPSLCRQGLASIATVALNVNAAVYGDAAVAAMSVVGRLYMLVMSVMLGFGQGFQPVVGYNYGANRFDRVRQAFSFAIKVGAVVLSSLAVLLFIFAPSLIMLFTKDDQAVIQMGAFAARAQALALPLQAVITLSNMLFQSTGQSLWATLIACARQGIFFLPLIFLLPALLGLTGVQITQPISDVCSVLLCIPFLLTFFKRLKILEKTAPKSGEKENLPAVPDAAAFLD